MVAWCAGISLVVAGLLRLANVNPMPFSQLVAVRTAFTIFVWLYLAATLLSPGARAEVMVIAMIPFLAQFYQVALGRDFGQGTAVARILPYFAMAVAMGRAIALRGWRPTFNEVLVFGAIWIVGLVGIATGIHLSAAGVPSLFYIGVLLPLFYGYVESLAISGSVRLDELMLALTTAAFLLLGGTFVIMQLGLQVETAEGFGTVASAMQAADFNSIAAYLLLLWPFALAFTVRRSRLLVVVLLAALLATVFAGLSRTMLLLTPVLVLASMPAYFRRITLRDTLLFIVLALPTGALALWTLSRWSLASFTIVRWAQRLDIGPVDPGSISIQDIIASVGPGSQSQETRALVREQGWEMFRRNPIVGQGWETYPFFSSVEQTSAHSLTVDWLSQAGLLGAVLLWWLLLLGLVRMLRGFFLDAWHARLLLAFLAAYMLWLVAANTMGAQIFLASDRGFTTGAINGVLLVLFLSRNTMNHVLRREVDRP